MIILMHIITFIVLKLARKNCVFIVVSYNMDHQHNQPWIFFSLEWLVLQISQPLEIKVLEQFWISISSM